MITQIPLFATELNPKIEYRMLVFCNLTRNSRESLYENLMVYNSKQPPITKEQKELVKLKSMYRVFKEKGLNEETINTFVDEFKACVEGSKKDKLLKFVLELENGFKDACSLFMFVVKNMCFGIHSYKFAILAFNAILFRNSMIPIIFNTNQSLQLFELIDSGLDMESLEDILMQMFQKSIEFNTPHQLITLDEIKRKIEELKMEIVERFDIEELFITGSYASGVFNKYSDLDLIVKMKNYDTIEELEKSLVSNIGIQVDCIRIDSPFAQYEDIVKFRIQVI